MNKKAFTLSEVLITIVIIGIVAALTVPNIVNTYTDMMYISALKKNYSIFSNAFNLSKKFDYNDYEDWDHLDGNVNSLYENYKYVKKYLTVIRECKNTEGCWSPNLTRNPSGRIAEGATSMGLGGSIFTFTLNDGTNVCFDYFNQADTISKFGVSENLLSSPLTIWVDVNGDKNPNRLGRDVFSFVLTTKGLVPAGANNNSANCKITGFDCSAKYLYTR